MNDSKESFQQFPLKANLRERTVEQVIEDLLDQSEVRGKTEEVARYLVGAKLMLRFSRDIPLNPASRGDRWDFDDQNARLGDFQIENTVIEVAVNLPDDKLLEQVAQILERNDLEVWLLTRLSRMETWRREIEKYVGNDRMRVVISSVESFVGQNVTELGTFSTRGKVSQLEKLFDLYNTKWIRVLGAIGVRIEY